MLLCYTIVMITLTVFQFIFITIGAAVAGSYMIGGLYDGTMTKGYNGLGKWFE